MRSLAPLLDEDTVAIDTAPAPDTSLPSGLRVDARRHARRGMLLMAFAVWNLWLWGTRTYNLFTADEDHTVAFIAVHLVLYVVSIAFGLVFGVMGWRMRQEAKR